ncbi:MAG: DUF3489 domain-containing protein [Bryobacteraceae bacterium]
MKTFTIDAENNISAFGTLEEAAAACSTPFDSFASQSELTELAATWPDERLLAIWNSLPGVTPAKKVKDRKTGIERIWKRIQRMGEPAPEAETDAQPASEQVIAVEPAAVTEPVETAAAAQEVIATNEPVEPPAKPAKKAARKEATPKAKKAAKARDAEAPREGSKTAQVVAMLQREKGATISEVMEAMGWQKHTVRGFMAGAMKKAGHKVESFKPEGCERSYRILSK